MENREFQMEMEMETKRSDVVCHMKKWPFVSEKLNAQTDMCTRFHFNRNICFFRR